MYVFLLRCISLPCSFPFTDDFGPRYEATVDRFRDIEAIAHELEQVQCLFIIMHLNHALYAVQSVPQQYERAERYESVANDVRSLKP